MALYGDACPQAGDRRAAGMKAAHELAGEISLRRYLTSDHTLVGAYWMLGLQWGLFIFEFAHPLRVEEGGRIRTFDTDVIDYVDFLLGVGISPVQLSRLEVGASACWGLRNHAGESFEGFDNDMFHPAGYWRVQLEVLFRGR